MQAPQINVTSVSNTTTARDLSSSRIQNDALTGQNQFSQVMDLVAPKEITEPVSRHNEIQQSDAARDNVSRKDEAQAIKHGKEEAQPVRETDHKDDHVQKQSTDVSQQAQNDQNTQALDPQQQAKLRLLAQMSQEDLLQLVQWQQNINQIQLNQTTQNEGPDLSHFKGISTGDLMALLNGFQHAQQPKFQSQMQAEFPQLQWLESQLLNTQNQSTQGLAQQLAQINQAQMQMNTAQQSTMQPVMDVMMRPQEVMPALNILRLTQAQKEGVVRQVAQGFKSQSNGTQSAEIRLHPEELGMVKLKVEMRGTDIRVFFSAENQLVGDLLTQNIDELKALLGDQEFNLVETGLFQDQLADEQQDTQDEGEDYGNDDRPDLKHRPKRGPRMSPLPGRFRATV
jgi:flagellar hook-length control protein FliK